MTVKRSTRWAGAATLAATTPLILGGLTSTASADTTELIDRPDTFTSAFVVEATGDNVVGPAPGNEVGVGDPDGEGLFLFFINSDEEIICWDITTVGVGNDYQSPARTATHIHQTAAGLNGPPRIAFPNPTGTGDELTSTGCSEGPFTTGLPVNGEPGTDTGTGFTLAQIEADPAGFSADTHTAQFVPGAVRGQLVFDQDLLDAANGVGEEEPPAPPADDDDLGGDDAAGDDDDRQLPVNGVDTGQGGTAGSGTSATLLGALTLGGLAAAGAVAIRRRQGA